MMLPDCEMTSVVITDRGLTRTLGDAECKNGGLDNILMQLTPVRDLPGQMIGHVM